MSYFTEEQKQAWRSIPLGDIPEGDYSGDIIEAEVKHITSKFSNGDAVKAHLKYNITSPLSMSGKTYVHSMSLSNPNAMPMTKENLSRLGIGDVDLDQIPLLVPQLVGMKVHFSITKSKSKEGRDYTNAKITGSHGSIPAVEDIQF